MFLTTVPLPEALTLLAIVFSSMIVLLSIPLIVVHFIDKKLERKDTELEELYERYEKIMAEEDKRRSSRFEKEKNRILKSLPKIKLN